RLEHGMVHLLGERGLGGLVVEGQNRDGLDVREPAAVESVETAREREGERANDARAKSRDRTPRSCPPRPPRTQNGPALPENRCGRSPASRGRRAPSGCAPAPCPAAATRPREHRDCSESAGKRAWHRPAPTARQGPVYREALPVTR